MAKYIKNKNLIYIIIGFLFVLQITLPAIVMKSLATDETTITFTDINMYNAMKTELSNYEGNNYVENFDDNLYTLGIKISNISLITELNLKQKTITDITGIEYFISLKTLDLSGNQIVNISSLSILTNLTNLNLNSNNIVDISSLSSLTNLIILNIGDNGVYSLNDISPISKLVNLTSLNIDNVNALDFSPIEGLTNLTTLSAKAGGILFFTSDLKTSIGEDLIITLPQRFTKALDPNSKLYSPEGLHIPEGCTLLSDNTVKVDTTVIGFISKGIYIVSGPSKDAYYWAEYNVLDVTSVTFPETRFYNMIKSNIASNIVGLNDATHTLEIRNIEKITSISNNGYYDTENIEGIQYFTGLTTLSFETQRISDISKLSSLTSLTSLTLKKCNIIDISALSELTNLTTLNLDNNFILDFTPIENLPLLTQFSAKDQWLSQKLGVYTLNLREEKIIDVDLIHKVLDKNNILYSAQGIEVTGQCQLTRR